MLSNIPDDPGTVAASIAIAATGDDPATTAATLSEARPKRRRIDDQVFKDKYTNCLKVALTKLKNSNRNVGNAKELQKSYCYAIVWYCSNEFLRYTAKGASQHHKMYNKDDKILH